MYLVERIKHYEFKFVYTCISAAILPAQAFWKEPLPFQLIRF